MGKGNSSTWCLLAWVLIATGSISIGISFIDIWNIFGRIFFNMIGVTSLFISGILINKWIDSEDWEYE